MATPPLFICVTCRKTDLSSVSSRELGDRVIMPAPQGGCWRRESELMTGQSPCSAWHTGTQSPLGENWPQALGVQSECSGLSRSSSHLAWWFGFLSHKQFPASVGHSQHQGTAGSGPSPSPKHTRPALESSSLPISSSPLSPPQRGQPKTPHPPQPGEPDPLPRAGPHGACAARKPRACPLPPAASPQVRPRFRDAARRGAPGFRLPLRGRCVPAPDRRAVTSRRGRARRRWVGWR